MGKAMMASEVARELAKFLEQYGDHEVKVYANGCGGHYNCEPYTGVDEVAPYCPEAGGKLVLRIESEMW